MTLRSSPALTMVMVILALKHRPYKEQGNTGSRMTAGGPWPRQRAKGPAGQSELLSGKSAVAGAVS